MRKKIILIFSFILLILIASGCGAEENYGLNVSVDSFITKLKAASGKVPFGFNTDMLNKNLITTEDGNYIAEYDDTLHLLIYTIPKSMILKNVALSFLLNSESRVREKQDLFESLCKQLILAFESNMTQTDLRRVLWRLGLYGPVFDGNQRSVRSGKHAFILKMYNGGIIVFVVTAAQGTV
ncbi:MAG: hypothetical protein HUJ86_08195 [Synergistes sp.]|nr:hypothetical protein [Synergistes sp.]